MIKGSLRMTVDKLNEHAIVCNVSTQYSVFTDVFYEQFNKSPIKQTLNRK